MERNHLLLVIGNVRPLCVTSLMSFTRHSRQHVLDVWQNYSAPHPHPNAAAVSDHFTSDSRSAAQDITHFTTLGILGRVEISQINANPG